MAAVVFRRAWQTIRRNAASFCRDAYRNWTRAGLIGKSVALAPVVGSSAWYVCRRAGHDSRRPGGVRGASSALCESDSCGTGAASGRTPQPSYREQRFRQFASVEYEENIYMTPQDFLESVLEETPRSRIHRRKLTKKEVEHMVKDVPKKSKGSTRLFRSLHGQGIISYTEYLFLLCVLTKPHSGFRIAFNMFDADGNQMVDKKEFLVLETFFTLPTTERKFIPRQEKPLKALLSLERIFSAQGVQQNTAGTDASSSQETTASEAAAHAVPDTTLLIHFFGMKGTDVLKYEDFHRFMENLQIEVIELEFTDFSKGMLTISEEDFARILLRYTLLDKSEIEECICRVKDRMPETKGISFQEFKKFCQFLNNLDDFSIAMRMYTYADQPVSQEEFQRAVKVCTGFTLGPHLVNTVFQIFDADGDGHLSHKEFISIMKDRIHRGARAHLMHTHGSWDSFKACVKNEMRSY